MRYFPLARGFTIYSGFRPPDRPDHSGVDFGREGGSAGLPVYACQSGTVLFAGAASGYGGPDPAGWLVIDSTDAEGGGCTEFGHIIREVGVGDHVEAGQRIAHINPDSGSNGGVPPHVHVSRMPREYRPATKIDPLPWLSQATYPAEQQPPGGTVAPPLPNAQQLIDVASPLSVQTVHDRGYAGRQWYLARPNGGVPGITIADFHESARLGQIVDLNYEAGAGNWMLGGWDAGVKAGWWIRDRVSEFVAAGITNIRCVKLSADSHFSPSDLDAVEACARGAQSVVGNLARGIYGFYETMDRFHDKGLADFYWQCGAQSDLRPWVGLYQRNNDGDVFPGVGAVDCNDIFAADFGQVMPAAANPPMVGGAIGDLFNTLGGPGGFLGNPTTPETGCPDGVGRYNHFDNGSIYYTPTTGAHEVHGSIRDTWQAQGWETGKWGYPISNEISCSEGVHQYFQGCAVFYRTFNHNITELK